jgi:ATP-dependent RNA helicase SUPV3L1/SUV3
VVYGSLPPETRRAQAELFNAGKNQILVATDAIGMGLNLQIGRVILSTMRKFDGARMRNLAPAETKQIVGRAGRFGSQFPVGHGAVLQERDVALLKEHMQQDVPKLPHAGLQPPYELIRAVSYDQPGV